MFYVVNKPLWISSNLVSKILKRVLDVPKIGFAWTLDPLATGLLIIGTEWSPRLFPLLESLPKTYKTSIRLDGTTDSYDLEQPIKLLTLEKKIVEKINQEKIELVVQKHFMGDILQSPPMYSAIWLDGQRAYELARKWENKVIEPKKRSIYSFTIVSYLWPLLICEIRASHGTYIRSIARDLWAVLWTGGYIEKLERTSIGHIHLENYQWTQHNDIYYSPLSHEMLFPDIPVLKLSREENIHLRLWSTPINTTQNNGYYFIQYEDGAYGLLEAKEGVLFPIKNAV